MQPVQLGTQIFQLAFGCGEFGLEPGLEAPDFVLEAVAQRDQLLDERADDRLDVQAAALLACELCQHCPTQLAAA
jgi:hypothetical protein